jgi:hypothetical protein
MPPPGEITEQAGRFGPNILDPNVSSGASSHRRKLCEAMNKKKLFILVLDS